MLNRTNAVQTMDDRLLQRLEEIRTILGKSQKYLGLNFGQIVELTRMNPVVLDALIDGTTRLPRWSTIQKVEWVIQEYQLEDVVYVEAPPPKLRTYQRRRKLNLIDTRAKAWQKPLPSWVIARNRRVKQR